MVVKKNADGTIDKRTKEGKAIAERMAKARAAAAKKASAVKKTTAAKATVAKKAATNKATIKVTVKPAAKTTTAKTTVKTTTTGLSVTGNKKIGTLMKEFNKQFPYLRLKICYSYARDAVKKGESISGIDVEKTLASVRRANSGGDISISGNKKIKSLEKEFDTVFGLYVQVCYTEKDGHRYYTSGNSDEKTLAAFNAECEKNGCKKGVWK